MLNISSAHRCAAVCVTAHGSSATCHYVAMASKPHTLSARQIKNRFDKRIPATTLSQQSTLQCSELLPALSKVYVKEGSCLQHMPLSRQKQQTNPCFNRKRHIVNFTQLWRCGTFNAAVPLDLSPVGETEK